MPYLELRDGVPLYYEDHGAGQAIVLVPGWTLTTRFWERQIEDLAHDYRVVTLDLRGAGNSGKTPDGHSLSGYADDLDELFRRLDLRDAVLVGYAMGVSVAVHYLVAHGQERVAGLVWVDHSPRFYATTDWPYALLATSLLSSSMRLSASCGMTVPRRPGSCSTSCSRRLRLG